MEVEAFSEIEEEFISRVNSIVWCNVATVDAYGRPRSRVMHPIWEGLTGWIATHRYSFKSRHLEHNPYVSLAYIADITKPVYVDCIAEWVDDFTEKLRVWNLFKNVPPPLGYDPAIDFIRPNHENFGLLKLIPWRIAIITTPAPSQMEGQRVWHNKEIGQFSHCRRPV